MGGGDQWGGGEWLWENGDNCTLTTIKNKNNERKELCQETNLSITLLVIHNSHNITNQENYWSPMTECNHINSSH